ncbi:MAG: hypothetical protein R2991_00830 [Thermoanaerobaculia bacterium]
MDYTPRLATALLACAALTPLAALAQDAPASPPPEAVRRMEHVLGRWESTWEWVDAEGTVVYVEHGTETGRWALEGRLLELTTEIEGRDGPSKGWMFWNAPAERFQLVSVGWDGDLWILSGGLEEYVIASEPKAMPDGKTLQIRFTHGEAGPDTLTAVMEMRGSSEEPWTVRVRQTMVRSS